MEQVTTDKLLRDLKVVAEDAEALLAATAGQTGEKINEVRARAQASLAEVRERLREAGSEFRAQAKSAATSADDYVHEKPWMAIAIAAGLGFLIGSFSNRR